MEIPPGHARHRRQRLPVKVILQHRRLSAWRPGPAAVRLLAQSAFVDEDDRAALVFGVFFYLGPAFLLPHTNLPSAPPPARSAGPLAAPSQWPQNPPRMP